MSIPTIPIKAWAVGPGTPVRRVGCTSSFSITLSAWNAGISFCFSSPAFLLTGLRSHWYTGTEDPSTTSPSSRLRTIPLPDGSWMIRTATGMPSDWSTTTKATAPKYIAQQSSRSSYLIFHQFFDLAPVTNLHSHEVGPARKRIRSHLDLHGRLILLQSLHLADPPGRIKHLNDHRT